MPQQSPRTNPDRSKLFTAGLLACATVGSLAASYVGFDMLRRQQSGSGNELNPDNPIATVEGGSAHYRDLTAEQYLSDPIFRVRCVERLTKITLADSSNIAFARQLIEADELLRSFETKSDFELFLKPGLRTATSQSLALASEEACRYLNKCGNNNLEIDGNTKSLPLSLLSASHQTTMPTLSDFSLKFVADGVEHEIAIDQNPSYRFSEMTSELRDAIHLMLNRLTAPQHRNSSHVGIVVGAKDAFSELGEGV